MAEYTAVAAQTVAVNDNLRFTETPIAGNCSIVHRQGSGLILLRGLTHQCKARFRVFFGSNVSVPIGVPTGIIKIVLAINGEELASSTMKSFIDTTENPLNIATEALIDVPAGSSLTISIKNQSENPITMENSNIIIDRVA